MSDFSTWRRFLAVPPCVIGAASMIVVGGYWIAEGSKGDAPDMAKLVLTSSGSFAANLSISAVDALTPGRIRGERPPDLFRQIGLNVRRGTGVFSLN